MSIDWTTLLRAQQADFLEKLKTFSMAKLQPLPKLALSVFLALIISLIWVVIPGVSINKALAAEAHPINKLEPVSLKKNPLSFLEKVGSFITSGTGFLSDNSVFRASFAANLAFSPTLAPTFTPTLAPTFAPSLSLMRIDSFFTVQELNLININIGDKENTTSSILKLYKDGLNKVKEKGDFKNAIKDYSNALSKGNFAEGYVSRGRAYSRLGDEQKALEYQQKDIEEQELELGNKQKKREYRQQVIKYQEKSNEYQQKAIADYTKALAVNPKFPFEPEDGKWQPDPDRYVEPLLGRAAVYIKLGNYQAALDDFNEAIKRNPDFYDAYLGRSTIYLGIEDYQKAIEDLNVALDLNLDYPAAFLRRGSIWGELGEYEKAIEDFNEAIESKAEDASTYYADSYYKRGLAYLKLAENQKAVENFNEAIKLDSKYREAYYSRGIAYDKQGKYNEAIKDYSQALLIYNISASSWYEGAVHSVAISPDSKTIASGSDDSTIKLWNTKDGQEIKTLYQPQTKELYRWIQAVTFSPDGKTIAAGSSNRSVKLLCI
ncbi:tetratricopeptide repeat protein [Coleofasciculus sp. H7-2]|uniref:tetratricopeptide repeat protein n=1 Tax=Coleofasciculus sp. H7-2 TaxID=3351545 RepID=UPI00366FD3B7